jgi:hypothetical protein
MYCKWKDNWEESRAHYRKWWAREGLLIANWGGGLRQTEQLRPVEDPGPPASLDQKYTDAEWIARNGHHSQGYLWTPLDMLPIVLPDIHTVSLAAMLGAQPAFDENNIWYNHAPGFSPDSDRELVFSEDSKWWKIISESSRAVKSMSEGNYFTGCSAVGPNLDVLAEIRGTQNLMMDLVMEPEWVHAKLQEIETAFETVYPKLYDIIKEEDGSSVMGYFMVWAPGTVCLAQCDTAAMISPEMFGEFAVPCLRQQCDFTDYSIYHVDGPAAVPTVDYLLEIESLDAIEYTPGPNVPKGSDPHWWDMYRKIKKAGKAVQIIDVLPDEVVPLLDELGPEGTCLHVWCKDRQAVEQVEHCVEPYR